MSVLNVQYRLRFEDGQARIIDLQLDRETLETHRRSGAEAPVWTVLDFYRCPNCPLDPAAHSHCPAALNVMELMEVFGDMVSHTQVQVEVVTPERRISADTSLQRAVSSLLGLVVATSGCPHTRFLKPMARFHLPFASEEETIYRATSMFLLSQYFVRKNGGAADMDLRGLAEIYRNLQIVNGAMAKRLRAASERDAAVNAIVLLDLFAKTLPYSIEESLDEIRYLFQAYLEPVLTD